MDSDFISGTTDRTVTVHDWCKRRNKRREQCDLLSLIGVARSADEMCVCVISTTSPMWATKLMTAFFVISENQSTFSGVTKKEDGFHIAINLEAGPIVFPSLELRKDINDCHDLHHVTFFPIIGILHRSQSLLEIVLSIAGLTANVKGVFNCICLDLAFPTPKI